MLAISSWLGVGSTLATTTSQPRMGTVLHLQRDSMFFVPMRPHPLGWRGSSAKLVLAGSLAGSLTTCPLLCVAVLQELVARLGPKAVKAAPGEASAVLEMFHGIAWHIQSNTGMALGEQLHPRQPLHTLLCAWQQSFRESLCQPDTASLTLLCVCVCVCVLQRLLRQTFCWCLSALLRNSLTARRPLLPIKVGWEKLVILPLYSENCSVC